MDGSGRMAVHRLPMGRVAATLGAATAGLTAEAEAAAVAMCCICGVVGAGAGRA